jgi:hypothetical protein
LEGNMTKLKLRLDDLSVETFQTAPAENARGTVLGNDDSDPTDGTCGGYATCDASCEGSCYNTCNNTCGGGTCDGTCGFTCSMSCYGTCRNYRTQCLAPF